MLYAVLWNARVENGGSLHRERGIIATRKRRDVRTPDKRKLGSAPTLAHSPWSRHHREMGQDPTHQGKSGAFSMASVGDTTQATTNPASSVHERRHVLPKDLPNAIKHLNDEHRPLASSRSGVKK
jgi:hypothetical protein